MNHGYLEFHNSRWYTNLASSNMLLTMKKVGLLSLTLGIALISVLATCHAINRSGAMMADGAEHQPLSLVVASPNDSQECCLFVSHGMPISFLASASERSNAWYLVGAVAALFALWRLRDKDQDTDLRSPLGRARNGFVFRFLQEAFSRGILHPRIYEPAFV